MIKNEGVRNYRGYLQDDYLEDDGQSWNSGTGSSRTSSLHRRRAKHADRNNQTAMKNQQSRSGSAADSHDGYDYSDTDKYQSPRPLPKLRNQHNQRKKPTGPPGGQSQKHRPLPMMPHQQMNHLHINDVCINGLIYDVYIDVDPQRHKYGRQTSLCELLFGIVEGAFSEKLLEITGLNEDCIQVLALTPGGEAVKHGHIKIGDWLMRVNDLDVTLSNLNAILSAITSPRKIKLTLQTLVDDPPPKPPPVRKLTTSAANELIQMVQGERVGLFSPDLGSLPHAVMYLTLDVSSDVMLEKEDVLYQFPKEDSKLVEARGMFTTLTHMMVDVTGNPAVNSTLVIDDQLVHVGYLKEGQEVLMLAVPALRMDLYELNKLMSNMSRLLKLLYGSLKSALTQKDNHGRLDHLFHLMLQRELFKQEMVTYRIRVPDSAEPFYDLLDGARGLELPEEIKLTVNNCLSEFESADFYDMSEDYYDMRRSYTILGSCLTYKGYLLSTHLPTSDLQDLLLYLRYFCLLTMAHSDQGGHLVAWTEVFPTRRCHSVIEPLLPGYTEPEAQWFYLVVGMNNLLFGVLLEAGGCARRAEGHLAPDPFLVDQAKSTLLQIQALDIPEHCLNRLESPSVPALASPGWYFPKVKGAKKEESSPKVNPLPHIGGSPSHRGQPDTVLMKKGIPSPQQDSRQHGRGAVYEMDSDMEGHMTPASSDAPTFFQQLRRQMSFGSEDSGESGSGSNMFQAQRRRRNLPSASDAHSVKAAGAELVERGSNAKLTRGCDNTLFHYVQLDQAEGVYICPTQPDLLRVNPSLHTSVLKNFHQACKHIHRVLHQTTSGQKKTTTFSEGFGEDSLLTPVHEHGILFECSPESWTDGKKPPPTMHYWVIGRLFDQPYPREVYVCFHDSAQQNMVELAFRLAFGVNI